MFSLLWGVPMLRGLGYSSTQAAGFLTVIVVVGFVAGPLLGILCARFPLRRSNLVLGVVVLLGAVWTAVLLWPGHPPTWLLVLLVVAMGIGGPGSLIGFDFARSFNPMGSLGSANGVVNVGGFLAAFVMMFCIGTLLDAVSHATGQTVFAWANFRVALTVQYVVVGLRRGDAAARAATDPCGDARPGRNTGGPALGCTRCTPAEAERAIMTHGPIGFPVSGAPSRAPVSPGDLTWVLVLPERTGPATRGRLRRRPWAARESHEPVNVARRER